MSLASPHLQESLVPLHQEASAIGAEALGEKLGLAELGMLCRALTAGGLLPDRKLLEVAARRWRQELKGGTSTDVVDAGAGLALASCEAGEERGLGAELVGELAMAVADGAAGEQTLRGSGAVALALAAAASGRADAALFDVLVARAAAREMDLSAPMLGDLRLAAALAGPAAVEELDVRSSNFLRALCFSEALDDPRLATGQVAADAAGDMVLTSFEEEVSDTLNEFEMQHTRNAMVSGIHVPLSTVKGVAGERQLAFFPEDVLEKSVYTNDPSKVVAFQRWKYDVLGSLGWRVVRVSAASWRSLPSRDERVAHMRGLARPDAARGAESE